MNREDALMRENEALRERFSKLSEASLRINENLDFDTVLQDVVDAARALTKSRYGGMAVFELSGELQAFVTSGFNEEELTRFFALPEAQALFLHLGRLAEPLRVSDFRSHIRSLGFPDIQFPMHVGEAFPFLAAPIAGRGELIGNIYLAEKDDHRGFTSEDEEILVMFASQAAMIISNARRYREEQGARSDLQALIDTSPVGVAVFNPHSAALVSFNREAVRIVDSLRDPDQSPEQLLHVLTCRRADGQEISLRKTPIADLLRQAEAVQAEEVVFEVPDGRCVAVLLNATPIRSGDGEIKSVVVTMQDMRPLEEMERIRAEFLAMVSHELRTPIATVKGSVNTLLDPQSALNPTVIRQFHQIIDTQMDRMHSLINDLLDVARIETGSLPVSPEPTDIALLTGEAADAFRVGENRHILRIDVPPNLPWVMADRFRIAQVLGNLLNNAAKHSPDSSTIRVSATAGDLEVSVSVSDDGRGIPAESLPHMFRKFSRIGEDDQKGDTGLGLAVCKGIVEAHGGRIWAESDGPGLGARFTFTLPTVEERGFISPSAILDLSTRPASRSSREQVRILAVDDDPRALRYVRDPLVKSGYAVIATGDPNEVSRIMAEEKPHLVLLDLMLPGIDGVDLMKEITRSNDVPVIFVSAYGQDRLIARAFEMGADDYLVKPFSPTELVARIRAALRRRMTTEPAVPYVVGDLTIDYAERLVTIRSEPVVLTAIEYRLLVELSAHPGRVLTYAHLLRQVWGDEGDGDVRPIRTIVTSIRSKLGDNADSPTYLFTERGVGYRMPRADGSARGQATTL